MTLGEKINILRRQKGWSQEELAEKLGISRQSVSKWEGENSIPDLDKLVKISELFEVSTDCLLKENFDLPEINASNNINEDSCEKTEPLLCLSFNEASDYLHLVENISKKMAFAISLFVLSPICLIIFLSLSSDHGFNHGHGIMTEHFAMSIGLAILLLLVAFGVAIVVINGLKLSKYEYLQTEIFILSEEAKKDTENKINLFDTTFQYGITGGVVLCILSVIPLFLASALNAAAWISLWCVSLLLILVAIAVFLFVWVCMIHDSHNKLLQLNDYSPENKEFVKKTSFHKIYWCVITAIYLIVSFYSNNWDSTWIIWPVAGVSFAAICSIMKTVMRTKKHK